MANLIEFEILFPEFLPVSDITVQLYLDRMDVFLSGEQPNVQNTAWGNCYDDAVYYLTAHEIALSQNRQAVTKTDANGLMITSSSAGAITSASESRLSVSFASPKSLTDGSSVDAYYALTQYGQRYLALKQQCLSQGGIVTCASSQLSQTRTL